MSRERVLLLVNDDGIDSEGLRRLAEAACELGEVYIAAPAEQCSAMSQRITIGKPLEVRSVDYPVDVADAWCVGGSPADCVKAAVSYLLPKTPELVLSGINRGYNAGFDTAYSGTVGAAMEARMLGFPAIALSESYEGEHPVTDAYLPFLLAELMERPIGGNEIWNVNFPGCPLGELKGIEPDAFPAPMSYFQDNYCWRRGEKGSFLLENIPDPLPTEQLPEGSDLRALMENRISIGKLRCALLPEREEEGPV